jgi:hypothetical protein
MMIYVESNYQIKRHNELSNTKHILNMCGVVLMNLV